MQQMPEHHSSTLSYVMAHLCRISQLQHARGTNEPPMLLVQILCHTLLRPPWERVMWVPHIYWIPICIIEYLNLWLSSSSMIYRVVMSSILNKFQLNFKWFAYHFAFIYSFCLPLKSWTKFQLFFSFQFANKNYFSFALLVIYILGILLVFIPSKVIHIFDHTDLTLLWNLFVWCVSS